ncbi:MAG: hypothetical protein ABIQ91_01470 [Candidatus Paceibacterota bacterium]
MGTGAFLYLLYNFFYDWAFYPGVIGFFGYRLGGTIAVAGSLLQCGVMFWLYDWMKIDWLGAHFLRELEDKDNKTHLEKMAVWIGKEKRTVSEKVIASVTFLILTAGIDPLVVAVHFKRSHFKGLTSRDWGLLLASVAAANAWWLLKVGTFVAVIKMLFLGHW